MRNLRQDSRTSMMLAVFAIVVLLVAGSAVLEAIERESRRAVSGHVLSTLDAMTRLLDLQHEDAMARVRTIAEEPRLKQLAVRLADGRHAAGTHAEFADWISPIYRSRGFEGYSLISADRRLILTSGSAAYIGRKVETDAARSTLLLAERSGVAVSRPTEARHQVTTHGQTGPAGLPYQLACARVDGETGVLGYLCLRDNPALRLYRLLEAGHTGDSGEAYVIGENGHILSPVRFERELIAPTDAKSGWSLFQLHARHDPATALAGRLLAPATGDAPLTRVAAAMLEQQGSSGYIEGYPDYRGRRVVGAGRWLAGLNMGLVVEEDVAEAYRSYRYARNVLVALIGLGVALILALTYLQWRSRRSLARSEQQLAAFRDYIPAGMHLKDVAGRYLMTNPVFEAVFHLPPGRAIGRTDAELMPAEEARRRQTEHEEVLRSGRPVRSNYTTRYAGGDEAVYSVVRFPILDEDGATITAVGTVGFDISGEIKAQHELEELTRTLEQKVVERTKELVAARDMAEAAGRAKAEFLANMSHEIRTPLNAIIGMSHLAARVNAEPRVAHYITRIQGSGQHLLGIVNDILDLSKIEAGKLQIESVEFSIERLLEHVAGLIWERADGKGLELIIDIEPSLPDRVIGDSMRIGQILINFANNAVKFTEQGEVVLRVRLVRRDGDRVTLRFEVEDTGIGIADEKLPLLFSPFQQLDGSMSRRFEGTGLGLAISKHLTELMGGEVAVSTRLGQGSIFSLEIELRVGVAIASPIMPTIDLRNRRVLVVDDNAHARRQLVALLRSLSFRVDEASGGQEGTDRVADADADGRPYDLIFVDWKMPGLNGRETAAQVRLLSLRQERPRMALIASGARDALAVDDRAGFDAVINKPVTPSELFDTVIGLFDPMRMNDLQPPEQNGDWPSLHGFDILLVEDNPINQEVVHDLLKLVGARVTIAGDGLRALQLLNNQRFDAVLMDVHMPIMNGFEATSTIRRDARFAALPIIALTANALEGDREHCLAVGMSDYVAKPIDPQALFSTLLRHLPAVRDDAAAASASRNDEVQVKEPGGSGGDDRVLAALAALPGLDVPLGLSRLMGRPDLYVKLVRRVAGERAGLPAELTAAQAAGEREQLRGLIHGIKSLLGALGASDLQRRCVALEARLDGEQPAADELVRFVAEYQALIAGLQRVLGDNRV